MPAKGNPAICGAFKSALGRTRTCDLLIRSERFRAPPLGPVWPCLRAFCPGTTSSSPQLIHDAITFLLGHMPPQMHLVIAGRTDPPCR
jgi:hypothetical protein